ncbi:hypothetical protein [Mesorhizobium sp. 128a]
MARSAAGARNQGGRSGRENYHLPNFQIRKRLFRMKAACRYHFLKTQGAGGVILPASNALFGEKKPMLFPGQVVMSDKLEMLARVCRTACAENGVALSSPQAQTIARHILKLFLNGLEGEDELVSAERNRMKRQARIQH